MKELEYIFVKLQFFDENAFNGTPESCHDIFEGMELAGWQAGETDCSWCTGRRIDRDQLVWKHNALSSAQETNISVRRKEELQFARMTANHGLQNTGVEMTWKDFHPTIS